MNDDLEIDVAQEPSIDDIAIEELGDTSAGSFSFGTVGTAGCPSSAGTVGTASSH